MAIEIVERFEVDAPIEEVWSFFMSPEKVVVCLPGASLDEVVDERTFLGRVKVKIGAVTASYKGKVSFTEVDADGFRIQMLAEGREAGGGTAKGVMSSRLLRTAGGGTEVVAEASVDLTGRLMQVGRGMISGVSKQLFQQFVNKARGELEKPSATTPGSTVAGALASSDAAPMPVPAISDDAATRTERVEESINLIPLVARALWEAIVGFLRRLFGGGRKAA